MKGKEDIRIYVRCLKATAKDYLPIGKLLFDDALYALPSALADGQISNAVRSGDADRSVENLTGSGR